MSSKRVRTFADFVKEQMANPSQEQVDSFFGSPYGPTGFLDPFGELLYRRSRAAQSVAAVYVHDSGSATVIEGEYEAIE